MKTMYNLYFPGEQKGTLAVPRLSQVPKRVFSTEAVIQTRTGVIRLQTWPLPQLSLVASPPAIPCDSTPAPGR